MSKRFKALLEKVDAEKQYSVNDAVATVKGLASAKFDETVELSLNLNVDPRHADQMIRGSVVLPNGTGKTVRVAVMAKGTKMDEATAAGADIVGNDDLVEAIQAGNIDFDVLIATPDTMGLVGKIGRILGPKGLMPNPKLGSVSENIKEAVTNAKSGQVEIRNDKDGNIGVSIGKKSFHDDQLLKNFHAVLDALEKEKSNNTLKGDLIRNTFATSTMGVSYKVKLGKSI